MCNRALLMKSGPTAVRDVCCDPAQRKAESGWLVLTDDGLSLSDYLGPQLISREISEKMAEWETAHGQTN